MIGRKLSHFKILDRIGEGGMGVVYRAEDEKLQRVVALKVLPPDRLADQERRLRFLREARAAAAVTHPGIAVVHEIDESDGVVFIAMELVGGRTLRAVIGGRPMPFREALRLGVEIAEALSAAHQARLVHRDLKPDNVMVTQDGRVKILDFGLAKLIEERVEPAPGESSRLATISDEMTKAGRVLGTAAYMSPEQIRGQSVDTRSDLFAFGVVVYEMVAGAPPFRGATSMDVMSAILNKEASPPSQINAEVPPELDRIVGKCLEKDPAERYQDTRDLAVDLRRLRRDTESGAASRPSATGRKDEIRSTRRRPLVTALVWAGLVVALMAAGLGAWRLWPRAPKAGLPVRRLLLSGEEVGRVVGASLSPDGNHLAYSREGELVVRELASGATRTLSLPESRSATGANWSPDGSHLYTTVSVDPASSQLSSLWVVSVLTGTSRRLGEGVSEALWPSPDGKLIAFLRSDAKDRPLKELWVMGSQGDSPRQVFSLAADDQIFRVAWSPDSRWLAIIRIWSIGNPEQGIAIEVWDLAGQKRALLVSGSQLWHHYRGTGNLCWLADGRLLYSRFELSPHEYDSNVWGIQVDLDTGRAAGEARKLTSWSDGWVQTRGASADGKRLLLSRSAPQGDVYVGSLAEGGRMNDLRRLTFSGAEDWPVGWTRDGRVLLISDRAGNPNLFVQAIDSREPTALLAGTEEVMEAVPAPDGTAVLYWTRDPRGEGNQQRTLRRLDLADGTTRILGTIEPKTLLDCPTLAGAQCVVVERNDREIAFSLFDPDRGKGKEFARLTLPVDPYSSWGLSPDGRRIALVTGESPMRNQLRIVEVPGGEVQQIVPRGIEGLERVAFSADGKALFASVGWYAMTGGATLLYISLDGRTTVIHRFEEGKRTLAFIPSPDGRSLAFVVAAFLPDLWLLENF